MEKEVRATLKFGNMGWDNKGFLDGINMTVRKGCYWDIKVREGETINVATFDGEFLGEAVVIEKMLIPFINIPRWALAYQHEKTFQNYDDLFVAMRRAYNNKFDESEIVTILFFKFLKNIEDMENTND